MTDLQRKSFELLEIFVGICEKFDIPYYLVCGSALGAVKYEGFIPWDDDIDVGLLRPDYQHFVELAPRELPNWCFLQNYLSEKTFPQTYSKLRNSETAFIEAGDAALPINHGIFIDIFPIDGYPQGKMEAKVFELKRKLNAWVRYSVYKNHANKKIHLRNKVLRFLGVHKFVHMAHKDLERLYQKYPVEQSDLWCNYGNWQGKLEYAPRWHYGKGTWASFEGLRVRIPEKYDAYLTQKYGDWRSDPPLDKQKTHHEGIVIDTEKSYSHYYCEHTQPDMDCPRVEK